MGCDIHGIVQIKKDGVWVDECSGYEDRNYIVFSLIANVRNYGNITPISEPRGFPQEVYSTEVKKIKTSLMFKDESRFDCDENPHSRNGIWFGDHSHSFLLASELLNLEWDNSIKITGYMPVIDFIYWDRKSIPENTERYKSSGQALYVPDYIDETISKIGKKEAIEYFRRNEGVVLCSWETESLRSMVELFYENFVLSELKPLADKYGPENVRWVFGFDS